MKLNELPAAKAPKPTRQGTVWVLWNGPAVLLERRPDRGLLGGTLALPGTGWDGSDLGPPAEADWRAVGTVSHTFTHFHLELAVMAAEGSEAGRGSFHGPNSFAPQDLPTLMRKAYATALAARGT